MIGKPLNPARAHFAREYVTGHNGAEAYRTAYPKCKSGHKQCAAKLLTNADVKQEISRIISENAAKAEHNRGIAVKLLNENLAYLAERVLNGDIGAISARTAVIRELNACSGCHSSTLITKERPPALDPAEEEFLAEASKAYKERMSRVKLSKDKEIA